MSTPVTSEPSLNRPDDVVVTGLGAVSAFGWGAELLARGLTKGSTTLVPPERFDTQGHRTHLASEVPTRQAPADPGVPRSRADAFAVVAGGEALEQAGLTADDLHRLGPAVGLFFGGSTAGMDQAEHYFTRLRGMAEGRPLLRFLVSHQLNAPADAIARRFGIQGPVDTVSSACASGGLALGAAVDALRDGEVEVALAGGSDALCQLTYAGFNALRAVDVEPCRPFRGDREGLGLGEGAGVLVLETARHASARGARPIARVLGSGASCDSHHMTAPHPQGEGAAEAIRRALADAGVAPADVTFVNAHGTGTPHNDIAEWRALEAVFGPRAAEIPVTSTKGVVGHLLGSSGAIEAVATVQSLSSGAIHPTPGEGPPDPAMEVDLVLGSPRPIATPAVAVSTSFAFGGSNAAVVFGSAPGGDPSR